jgi:hypothetical protein
MRYRPPIRLDGISGGVTLPRSRAEKTVEGLRVASSIRKFQRILPGKIRLVAVAQTLEREPAQACTGSNLLWLVNGSHESVEQFT